MTDATAAANNAMTLAVLTGAPQKWVQHCRKLLTSDADADDWRQLENNEVWDRALNTGRPLPDSDDDLAINPEIIDVGVARAIRAVTRHLAGKDPADPADAIQPLLNQCCRTHLGSIGLGTLDALTDHIATAKTPHRDRLLALLHHLAATDHDATPYAALLACHLTDTLPRGVAIATIPVLYDPTNPDPEQSSPTLPGATGTLTLRHIPQGPPGLHPDPARMAFFASADTRFTENATNAWASSSLCMTDHSITWHLTLHGKTPTPANDVDGGSLGAAFGVALTDLHTSLTRRTMRVPLLRQLDLRSRITNPNATVTASVTDTDGTLGPVTGLDQKLLAARRSQIALVITHPDTPHDGTVNSIGTATNIREAVTKIHTYKNPAYTRSIRLISIATALVLLLGSGITYVLLHATHLRQQSILQETSRNLRDTALNLAPGDVEGRALLLAMAADDFAAKAGEATSTFKELVQDGDQSQVSRVLRSATGSFTRAETSPDGRFALLQTDAGGFQLVDLSSGHTDRQAQYPPGLSLAPGQVQVGALAFSSDSKTAAVDLSDGDIKVLRFDDQRWRDLVTLQYNESNPRVDSPLDAMINGPRSIALDAQGTRLVATSRTGMAWFDLRPFDPDKSLEGLPYQLWQPQHVCSKWTHINRSVYDGKTAYLLADDGVQAVNPRDCKGKRVLPAPHGYAELDASDLALAKNGEPVVVAVSGSNLVRIDSLGKIVTVASQGPYSSVHLSVVGDGSLRVAAANRGGTFLYDINTRKQVAGLRASGWFSAGEAAGVIVSGGYAAVLSSLPDSLGRTGLKLWSPQSTGVKWVGDRILIQTPAGLLLATPSPDFSSASETVLPQPEAGCRAWSNTTVSPNQLLVAATALCPSRGRRTAYVWDVSTATTAPAAVPSADALTAVAFAADSTLLAGGLSSAVLVNSEPNPLRYTIGHYTRTTDGQWISEIVRPTDQPVRSIAQGSDPTAVYAMIASDAKTAPTLLQVDLKTLDVVARKPFEGVAGVPRVITLSDGRVVVGYGDNLAVTDSALTRFQALKLRSSGGGSPLILALAESPSNRELLVTTLRKTAIVDLSSFTEVDSDKPWEGLGAALDISQDGTRLVQASAVPGYVEVFLIDPTTLRQHACAAIGRDLTAAEWATYVQPAQVTQFDVCPTVSPPTVNNFQNEQRWTASSTGVGSVQLGLTVQEAADAHVITENDDNAGSCSTYSFLGNWSDPALNGQEPIHPEFESDTPDARLYSLTINSRAFRTDKSRGVGDSLQDLKRTYGTALKMESTNGNQGPKTDPVIEAPGGLLVFELDSNGIVQDMVITNRSAAGEILLYSGC